MSSVPSSLIATLKKISKTPAGQNIERCDFCGQIIPPDHRHLADLAMMRFVCACEMCFLVQAEKGEFKPLPQRILFLKDFNMPDEVWQRLMIPVDMAFFTFSTARNKTTAFYPAPAGVTESQLELQVWHELEDLNPILKDLVPDVEALLVNRTREPQEYYILSIDHCYRLVGLMRMSWQGISGGQEAFETIARFFQEIKDKSTCPS